MRCAGMMELGFVGLLPPAAVWVFGSGRKGRRALANLVVFVASFALLPVSQPLGHLLTVTAITHAALELGVSDRHDSRPPARSQ
jgi:hypothetical protein